MFVLHAGYTEQKHEQTYCIQLMHYLQVFLFELFLRKISFGLLLSYDSLTSDDEPSRNTITDYHSSWTDDSSTCGEISDDSSLNSSSSWNSDTETPDAFAAFEDCTRDSNENASECEIESHAAMIIQRYLLSLDQEIDG